MCDHGSRGEMCLDIDKGSVGRLSTSLCLCFSGGSGLPDRLVATE